RFSSGGARYWRRAARGFGGRASSKGLRSVGIGRALESVCHELVADEVSGLGAGKISPAFRVEIERARGAFGQVPARGADGHDARNFEREECVARGGKLGLKWGTGIEALFAFRAALSAWGRRLEMDACGALGRLGSDEVFRRLVDKVDGDRDNDAGNRAGC